MKWQWIARWVILAVVFGSRAAYGQDAPKPQPTSIHAAAAVKEVSPALKRTGWIMVIVGGAMLIPAGTTYDIFGHDVCVDSYSVYDGPCRKSNLELKVAAATMAAGAAFVVIGGHKVALRPQISTHTKAVTATIRWK